jgi:alkylated DNA repair protein (DNA oxidative demethylase)
LTPSRNDIAEGTHTSHGSIGMSNTNKDAQKFSDGFHFLPGYLDETSQIALTLDVGRLFEKAPLFEQRMPRTGAPLSVRMSNAGDYGWVTDREKGYRYQRTHPVTGEAWPAIAERLLKLWSDLTRERQPPNLCLINFYSDDAKLGLHQDRGDSSLDAPVVSISLGDDATFLLGGLSRKDATRRLSLHSGDVVWFGGASRLIFHGVQGIKSGTSRLLDRIGLPNGRINLTLRRIDHRPTSDA